MLLSHSGYIHDTGTCEMLAAAGFEAIDMDDTIDAELFKGSFESACEQVKAWMAEAKSYGLAIHQCHAPMPGGTMGKTSEEIEAIICTIEQCIRVANVLHIPYTVIHPFVYDYHIADPDGENHMWELNISYLKRICKCATETTLCLENMPRSFGFLTNSVEMARMMNEVGDENLMVCFDTGHLFSQRELASHFFAQVGDRIRVTHIHDTVPKEDMHLLIGTGRIDWADFKQTIKDFGYCGNLNSESAFLRRLPDSLRLDGAILERKILETLIP